MARTPRATLLLLTITANAAFFGRQRKPEVPAGGLACDEGYTAVPSSHINDDYCDCADGADEPRTAACSGVTATSQFACADGSGVPASRVGDGGRPLRVYVTADSLPARLAFARALRDTLAAGGHAVEVDTQMTSR